MPPTDIHQHVWTAPLLAALSEREALPFVRRTPEGLTVLYSNGERPWVVGHEDLRGSPTARKRRLGGAGRAVVAISSPIGIETLEPESAHRLIAAHLDGIAELGSEFAAWGPLALGDPDPDQVDALLARGCEGIQVSAGALATRERFEAIAPALERAQASDAVVFVHPGPGPGDRPPEPGLGDPLWWPALTSYVTQMQHAWLTFSSHGRRELGRLRIVFGMLAGGAPLLSERLLTRGGPEVELADPLTYYETSSYGPKMVETMARWVGSSQLVYGSDLPVIEPLATGHEAELMTNAGHLMPLREVLV